MKKKWAMKWAAYLEKKGLKQAADTLFDLRDRPIDQATPKCCLGHLEYLVRGRKGVNTEGSHLFADMLLSNETMNTVGMSSTCGDFRSRATGKRLWAKVGAEGGSFDCLTSMNDAGVSLPEIAKVIRKHWRDL